MAPYMPHELEELILHHLRNDNTALRETSLACYRFAIVSQKLLFSSIRIDLTLGRSPEVFPNFLKAAPHIANAVRGIDVVADSYRLQTLDTSLIPCLSLVANLQHLSIDTNSTRPIYWRYLSPVMRSSLCDIARSNRLVTLRLRRVFEIPLSLIAECSNLEALSLCSIAFQQDDIQRILNGGWSLCPSKAAPKLRTLQLSISDEAFRVLLNFLIGSNALFDISTLTELSISIFNPRFDYANVNLILQAVGGSLEIFCFSPMIADSPGVHSRGERFSALRLHPLPRLRIFRLRLVADSAYKIKTTYSLFKNCASKILSQFGSDHRVEEISVKTSISLELKGDAFVTAAAPWLAVDAALNRVVTLRKMTLIIFQSDPKRPQAMSRIENAFPKLSEAGISLGVQVAKSQSGFLENGNDTDFLWDAFRRHNMA